MEIENRVLQINLVECKKQLGRMRDTILAWSNYDYFLVSKANFAFCCQFQDSCMARPSFYQRNHLNEAVSKNMKTSGNPKRWVGSPWNGRSRPKIVISSWNIWPVGPTPAGQRLLFYRREHQRRRRGCLQSFGRPPWLEDAGGLWQGWHRLCQQLGEVVQMENSKIIFFFYSMESSRESDFNPI